MKRPLWLTVVACLGACGTDLESDPAGLSVAGKLHYPPGQELADTYGNPGVVIFVQAVLADPATGAPGRAVAPSPSAVLLEQLDAGEIESLRNEGYTYELRNLNLGRNLDGTPLTAWPFVVIASLVDFDVFSTSAAAAYFQTSPFGGYPNVCALGLSSFQLPASTQALILAQVGGNTELATAVITAVTTRVIQALAVDPRVGRPTVLITRDVPTVDISFDLMDASQAPTTPVPCKAAIQEVVTREVTASLTRVAQGQDP